MKQEKFESPGVDNRSGLGSNDFFVQHMETTDLTDDIIKELGLHTLTDKGYEMGLEDSGEENLLPYAREVYNIENGTIYLAVSDGNAIGSATFRLLTRGESDDKSDTFWDYLEEEDSSLVSRAEQLAKTSRLVAAHAEGIVTLPAKRKQGIQRALAERFVDEIDPLVIAGISNAPPAVVARSENYWRLGYRTFFGTYEVTPDMSLGDNREELPHYSLLLAHLALLKQPPFINGLLETHISRVFDKSIFATIPPIIQEAFLPLVETKNILGRVHHALPLISVKGELLTA